MKLIHLFKCYLVAVLVVRIGAKFKHLYVTINVSTSGFTGTSIAKLMFIAEIN